jgi:two-component sensor histidine kinase
MMGLRVRLFLLVLIAVLPAIAIQIYNEIDLRRAREQEIHEEALRRANAVATGMLDILDGSRQLLVALARLPSVQAMSPEPCRTALATMLAELPGYTTVSAIDRAGRMICTAVGDVSPPPLVKDRTYFRDALQTNGFVVGEFAVGRATGLNALPVAQPIHLVSGETVGVLVAGVNLRWLEGHLRRRETLDGSTLLIVDRNGTVLVSLPDGGEQWVGRRLPEGHRPYIFGDQSATIELTDLKGTEQVFAYVPINFPPAGFAVAVGLDKHAALAQVETAMLRGFFLIFGGLGIGFFSAWLLGRHFVRRPVDALLDATRGWQRGDYSARVALADQTSEIGRLGHAFDEMAERLQLQLKQKDLLLREVNHRVMNSLQLLSSVLALQRRRILDPEARNQFEQARRRIQSLALVHRRLHQRDTTEAVEFGHFLEELCTDVVRTLGSEERPMPVEVVADPVEIGADKVIPLALIVYELLTNAFKYARPQTGQRSLRVAAVRDPNDMLIVTVSDNGPGLPPDFEQRAGLGVKLVQTLLLQLRGTMEAASGADGTTVTVAVPLGAAQPEKGQPMRIVDAPSETQGGSA